MAWLSNDLQPDRTQPKGLIVNARILWAFSAAYRAFSEPVFRQMAEPDPNYISSDCPIAGRAIMQGIEQQATTHATKAHPLTLLCIAYGLEHAGIAQ